jgi:hypothetical protein
MILHQFNFTEEKDADFAIFFTPAGGILASGYKIAFGLFYFAEFETELLLLCKVISNGPACDSLFSKTLK